MLDGNRARISTGNYGCPTVQTPGSCNTRSPAIHGCVDQRRPAVRLTTRYHQDRLLTSGLRVPAWRPAEPHDIRRVWILMARIWAALRNHIARGGRRGRHCRSKRIVEFAKPYEKVLVNPALNAAWFHCMVRRTQSPLRLLYRVKRSCR